MVKIAHVVNGKVVNISVANSLGPNDIDGTNAAIGDTYQDGQFIKPERVDPIPTSVKAWQLQVELESRGYLEQANTLVEQIGGELLIRWQKATDYERAFPAWDQFGAQLTPPLSPTDIDDVFRAASRRK